jgi:uncharacterized damage-inducible protein DinB
MAVPEELNLLFESFERNGRTNRALLDTLKMDDLNYADGVGGFNLGQHLADMVEFRPGWLARVSPDHAGQAPDVIDGAAPTWLKVTSIDELQVAFDAGDAAIRDAVLSAMQEGRKFEEAYQSHPAHLVQHCIVHDSHHRGQILALLRQAGRPAEEREQLEQETWPIWRE